MSSENDSSIGHNMMADVMQSAPPPLIDAMNQIQVGNLQAAAKALELGMPLIANMAQDWLGSALACQAFCLKEMGNYPDAIKISGIARKYGLNLFGYWNYFDTMINSLNQVDALDEALIVADEGIEFWKELGPDGLGNVAGILSPKANILKQLAVKAEKKENDKNKAKILIIEAMKAMCESLSISTLGWELEIGEKELEYIGNIAKRVGVTPADLGFMESMDAEAISIIDKYFGPTIFK